MSLKAPPFSVFVSRCILAVAVVLSSVAPGQEQESTSKATPLAAIGSNRSITIAFWNIQWFPGQRPDATTNAEQRQTAAVHKVMKQIDPDIIGMEEVRNFDKASLAVHPLRGFKVDVCANFPPREGQNEAQEVAIASRLPALSAWAEAWKPAGATTPPRGFAFAAYEVTPSQLLLVYCVHFKSNRGQITEDISIRQESARQLLSHINAMYQAYRGLGQITCVIGGDFNTSLDDQRFTTENSLRDLLKNSFLWVWQNTAVKSRMTLPSEKDFPAACFDHIFYRGATLHHVEVFNTTRESSDHKPVVAVFDLP
jgi:endonuclease/exonuclease/phosphatase family metal-dependent hydrolase